MSAINGHPLTNHLPAADTAASVSSDSAPLFQKKLQLLAQTGNGDPPQAPEDSDFDAETLLRRLYDEYQSGVWAGIDTGRLPTFEVFSQAVMEMYEAGADGDPELEFDIGNGPVKLTRSEWLEADVTESRLQELEFSGHANRYAAGWATDYWQAQGNLVPQGPEQAVIDLDALNTTPLPPAGQTLDPSKVYRVPIGESAQFTDVTEAVNATVKRIRNSGSQDFVMEFFPEGPGVPLAERFVYSWHSNYDI